MHHSSTQLRGHRLLAAYAQPDLGKSLIDIATSVIPYLALCVLSYATLGVSIILTGAIAVLETGFLVRTFVVFHDCAHGSLMPSKRANRYVGRFTGLLVLSPFARWRHDHAVHHATAGDLERRGIGDIVTLTTEEYNARSWRGRLQYRLLRTPVVMFGLGPILAMMVGPRIPTRSQRPRMRNSVLLTDAAVITIFAALCLLIGWKALLVVWAPSAMAAGSIGIWLFYVQHQFEDAYWESPGSWDFGDAALRGSSYLRLPSPLQFFTGNIGLHHVHHLDAHIPNYNLQRAHRETDLFQTVPTLSLRDGMKAINLKLWDQDSQKLVSFAQARRARISAATERLCGVDTDVETVGGSALAIGARTRAGSDRAARAQSRHGSHLRQT